MSTETTERLIRALNALKSNIRFVHNANCSYDRSVNSSPDSDHCACGLGERKANLNSAISNLKQSLREKP